jgi:hypothetical protein
LFVSAANVALVATNTAITGNTSLKSNSTVTAISIVGNSTATNTTVGGTTLNVPANVAFSGSFTYSGTANVNISSGLLFIDLNNNKIGIRDSAPSNTLTVNGAMSVTNTITHGFASHSVITYTNSNTDLQVIDSSNKTTYRSAKYLIQVKNNNANAHTVTEVLVLHDDGDAYLTEYGIINSNNSLGVFAATSNSTTFNLTFTPTSANSTVKMYKTLVTA